MKKLLSFLLFALAVTLNASARVIAEGFFPQFGGSWNITSDKVLHIHANVMTPNYYPEKAPWYNYLASIKTVEIGDEVVLIGKNTFYGLTGLTTVTDGANVTAIGACAFQGCSKLQRVSFPKVTSIGESAFQGCVNLQQAVLPKAETLYFQAFAGGDYEEYPMGNLQYVDLGSSIELLNGDCLNNAGLWKDDGTPSVFMSNAIPATITYIGDEAFYGCKNLKKITVESENPPTAEDHAFEKMYKDGTKLFVPSDTRFNYITRPWWDFIIIDPAWLSSMSARAAARLTTSIRGTNGSCQKTL